MMKEKEKEKEKTKNQLIRELKESQKRVSGLKENVARLVKSFQMDELQKELSCCSHFQQYLKTD